MTARRVVGGVLVLLVIALAYSGWKVWQVQQSLSDAESSADEFLSAVDAGDEQGQREALDKLVKSADSADSGTSGALWSFFTHLPVVGDDADGLRALSQSIKLVAEGAEPAVESINRLDEVTQDGGLDLDVVGDMQNPTGQAALAFEAAADKVEGKDSSGFAGPLRTRFDSYSDRVGALASTLAIANRALKVLPLMAGSESRQKYLFVFQNNAEIRATGGLPGSWAEITADAGRIEIVRQGAGSDFPVRRTSPIPLTREERAVYGDTLGRYFLGAGFTPDFPRAAQLFRAHFEDRYPSERLDGVLALDPVAVSYLLRGTGPITVDNVTLTSETAIEQLLSDPYRRLTPPKQDQFFQDVTDKLVSSFTGDLESPRNFVDGLARSGREGRFLVAPFNAEVAAELQDQPVLGAMARGGVGPEVEVALNDATGSKMSYYLRYRAKVDLASCDGGRAQLEGTVRLSQSIRPAEARQLPDYVTGGGIFGTAPGEQTVFVQIYGPVGSTMSDLRIDGRLERDQSTQLIDDRPVYVLAMSVRSVQETSITWQMQLADGLREGTVRVTPGVVPGSESSTFNSSCD